MSPEIGGIGQEELQKPELRDEIYISVFSPVFSQTLPAVKGLANSSYTH